MKEIRKYAIAAALLLAGCATTGCSEPEEGTPVPDSKTLISVHTADYEHPEGGEAGREDAAFGTLGACLFENGRLSDVFRVAGTTEFTMDRTQGTLYVVTDAEKLFDLEALRAQGISETEWLAMAAGLTDGVPTRFLSGQVKLSGTAAASVELLRSAARLDLRIQTDEEIAIHGLTVRNAAVESSLFASAQLPEAATGDITFRPERPYTEDTPAVAYLYEQANGRAALHLEATVAGKETGLDAPLPGTIRRNCIYTATVTFDRAAQQATLTVDEWETGGDTGLLPDLDGAITVEKNLSELPAGVTVDSDGRGLSLPYGDTELRLVLSCNDELELQFVAGVLLTVEPAGMTRSLEGKNAYRIRKALCPPGKPAEEVQLRFRRKGFDEVYPEDCITLHLEANPTTVEGEIDFDTESRAFDFGRYVDNELGRFTLPEGKELLAEFDPGEDPWVKLVASEGHARTIRIVGGWRPNDPTANGRIQSATLVIRNAADGSEREEYRISRRNYGLPVTWLHGVWWCKYNARGNSRSFDDQVLSASDPAAAAGKSVADYLRDCSPEAFYDLWGWAYQGDSGIGMRVVDNNGILVMEGYSSENSVHINKLPADALAPEGYELPSMEEFNRIFDSPDYVWVMWSGSHALRTPWEGHSIIKREQRRRNDVVVGSVAATDLLYTSMWSADFPQYEAVTWYGPGAQWNADGIKHSNHYNNILFSVYAPDGAGWFFSGTMSWLYLQQNGAGPKDTRIVRFKKSPVEYIYGE